MAGSAEYQKLKGQLISSKKLFEDPDFSASDSTLGDVSDVPSQIEWMRPGDLSSSPVFIVERVTNYDLDQGHLGDCWFISAAACVASSGVLTKKCMPADQDFKTDYCGLFRFNFWRFGKWVEILIDDRLPTYNGKLLYAHDNSNPDEFWAALLEKAFAKLHGGYGVIDGGQIGDALVDFTGGLSEIIDINDPSSVASDFYEILIKVSQMHSMMGSSIPATQISEEAQPNGLYTGHAYGITKLAEVQAGGMQVQLLRLQNPWGYGEWKGPWSFESAQWSSLSPAEQKSLQPNANVNGEFWISYQDWLENFKTVQFCHLSPAAFTTEVLVGKQSWKMAIYEGEWVVGQSAGGCGNSPYEDQFWTNPQYPIAISGGAGTDLIVSLMQEVDNESKDLSISFFSYKLRDNVDQPYEGQKYDSSMLDPVQDPPPFINLREVTGHVTVQSGATYVIIPATFDPNKAGKFILRIYSEQSITAPAKRKPASPAKSNETKPSEPVVTDSVPVQPETHRPQEEPNAEQEGRRPWWWCSIL